MNYRPRTALICFLVCSVSLAYTQPHAQSRITHARLQQPQTFSGKPAPVQSAVRTSPSFPQGSISQETLAAPPHVISPIPKPNAVDAARSGSVTARFSMAMDPGTLTQSSLVLHGGRSGRQTGVVSYDAAARRVTLTPDREFVFGENVQVTLTDTVASLEAHTRLSGGYSWKFNTGVLYGTADFSGPRIDLGPLVKPSVVACADLNGDGYTDLVVGSAYSGNTIYRNTQRGTFTCTGGYSTGDIGWAPIAVAIADLNGDGAPDIVTAHVSLGTVTVSFNDGHGNFTSIVSYPAGNAPTALAIADVNNDGSPDLAVTNGTDSSITFLVNNSAGSFTLLQRLAVGSDPCGIALEDVNNDGTIDALVTIKSKDLVTVVKNTGGVFAVDSSYSVGRAPSAIVAFDFDGDGFIDIAAANSGSTTVSVFLNDKTGKFIGPGNFELGTFGPAALCGADFDGDGDIDLAVSCPDSNQVVIMQNNGLTFPTVTAFPSVHTPAGIAAIDVSGTYGIMDVAVVNTADGTISLLKNKFFGHPPAALTADLTFLTFPDTRVGGSGKASIMLYSSITPLGIDSVTTSSGQFNAQTAFPIPLTSYDSVKVVFGFVPREFGTLLDTVLIFSSAGTLTLPVRGTSPAPAIRTSTSALAFGNCRLDSVATRTLVIRNSSINTLMLDSLFTGTRWFATTVKRGIVTTGDSLTVTLSFTPDAVKAYGDTLVIQNNSNTTRLAIPLSGRGDDGTSVAGIDAGIPAAYSLSQNYPNPFNPSTLFRFAVPKPSHVTLTVYDVTGRAIARVFNDDVGAGYYAAVWNASGVSSGMYFYRISADATGASGTGFMQTKKLVLIK